MQRYGMTVISIFAPGGKLDVSTSKGPAEIKFQYYSDTTHHSEGHSEVQPPFYKHYNCMVVRNTLLVKFGGGA